MSNFKAPGSSTQDTSDFLGSLYGQHASGWLTLWLLPTKHTQWFRASNIETAAAYAVRQASICDVYFGVGLRRERLSRGRGEAADVIALPGIYIDIDLRNPAHKATNLPGTVKDARHLLTQAIPLLPTFLVHSGHGLHGYWLFRELWIFETEAERQAAGRLLLRFQRTIQDTAKLRGWHVDGTADLARVLRLPATMNLKDPANPCPVTILEAYPGQHYNPSDFEPYLIEFEPNGNSTSSEPIPDDVPLIHVAMLKIPRWLKYLIRTGEHPDDPHRYSDRSRPEWAALQGLVKAGCDDLTIAGVMLNPKHAISEKPREKGKKWLADEITRAKEKARAYSAGAPETDGQTPHAEPSHEGDRNDASSRDSQAKQAQADDSTPPPGDERQSSEHRNIVLPWSDYTNAIRLVRAHGPDLCYCHPWKQWFIYNGQRWRIDDTGEVMRRAKQTVKVMAAELEHMDDNQAKAWLNHIKGSLAAPRLKAMITLAESEPPIPITPAQLDAAPWLLDCRNGTLNLRTGALQPHHREDLLTKQLDVNYDPHASCQNWLAFLYRIMGGPLPDEDGNEEALLEHHERATSLTEFLQRLVGYSLTGDIAQHILIFLYGTGANGKSTFSETMGAVLGDYFQKAPTQLFMQRDRGGTGTASPEMARLFGARMVIAAETSEGQRLNEAQVKDLTGGDTIVARHLFKEFFEFKPTHKLWMYGNHKPVIRGTDPGIWRRVHLIPFAVKIPDTEQDPHFRERFLMPELAGILAWAVRGCLAWQREGLKVPEAVKAATDSYRAEMDVLQHFVNERCVILHAATVRVSVLYAEYRKWCDTNQENTMNQRNFGMRLAERGFERERGTSGYYYWRGIGVFTPPEDDEEVK